MRRSSMCFSQLLALTQIAHLAVAQTKTTTKKTTSSSSTARSLKLPVEIQGGCMLACCKYGPWQATGRAIAYTARKASSSIAFTVQPGETGVILAGTGDPNDVLDSYYGAGILRSIDSGEPD